MKDIMYKIKKISELMGETTVFRVGVDSKNKKIALLSVDLSESAMKDKVEIAELPETEYIG